MSGHGDSEHVVSTVDLPEDIWHNIIKISPHEVLLTLSAVSKPLRSLSLPHLWAVSEIDPRKAQFLVKTLHLASLIRHATLIPSDFFANDCDAATTHLFKALVALLEKVDSLQLPLAPRDFGHPNIQAIASFNLPRACLKHLKVTHADPGPEYIANLATLCPDLETIGVDLYPEYFPYHLISQNEVDAFASALALFPNLHSIDLGVSVDPLIHPEERRPSRDTPRWLALDYLPSESEHDKHAISKQLDATINFAASNPALRRVVWCAPRRFRNPDEGTHSFHITKRVWWISRNGGCEQISEKDVLDGGLEWS